MKSIDSSVSPLSISARTAWVNGLTSCSGPPSVPSTICGPFSSSAGYGASYDWVSLIVST
jgi:hypothetical protein